MNETNQITRWRDDGAPPLFAALAAAHRAQAPDDVALSQMLARVEAHAGDPSPHYDAPAPATASLLGSVAVKLASVCALLLAGAGLWFSRAEPAPALQPAPAKTVLAAAPAREAAPSAIPEAAPAPAAKRSVKRVKPRALPAPTVVATPEDVSPSPLVELALLRRARRALAGQPAVALELTDRHRTEFAAGRFAEERELLAIEALLALSRRDDAEARASAFRLAFPRSLHLRRLAVLLDRAP